jgi:hypothetical protein
MAKILSERLAGPNDPIYTGGVETFAIRRKKPSEKSPKAKKSKDKPQPATDEGILQ